MSVHHLVLTPPLLFAAVSPGPFKPASSTATWLASALPSSAAVVKGFNNLSAYTLIHGDPLTEHMKSVAASDDYEAAQATAELGRAMGLEVCTAQH
jgi:predicted dinucleotide-binding enzyme